METDGTGERLELAGYVVDAHAVAEAIIRRLMAGRTAAPAPRKRSGR